MGNQSVWPAQDKIMPTKYKMPVKSQNIWQFHDFLYS